MWNCATRDDPMTASLPSLTSCSCVVVVCVLELLSATSSWTKTDRQEQHDESLHARNRICHDCAAQRCWSAVEPCLSTMCVCVTGDQSSPGATQCHECHACHAKPRPCVCVCDWKEAVVAAIWFCAFHSNCNFATVATVQTFFCNIPPKTPGSQCDICFSVIDYFQFSSLVYVRCSTLYGSRYCNTLA